jgi:hypothetical protein
LLSISSDSGGTSINQQQRPPTFNRGFSFQWLCLLPSTTKQRQLRQRQREQPQQQQQQQHHQERIFFEEQEQEQPTPKNWFSLPEQKPNSLGF